MWERTFQTWRGSMTPHFFNFILPSSANCAEMNAARSLKSDPFGVMDTRLTTTDSADDFFSLPFPAFRRLDKPAQTAERPNRMEAETSPMRDYRILELRESFRGFNSGRKCPRLELDATVDKYHLLDGLNEPPDPQNTPASNNERQGTPEPIQHDPENLQTSPAPQIGKLNFDCFQDSPEKGPFGKHRNSKPRYLFENPRHLFNAPITGLSDHRPAVNVGVFGNPDPSKPGHLIDNHGQRFKAPATGLGDSLTLNVSAFKKPSNPDSPVRCVRFSPLATSPSSPRAMNRPMPPVVRKMDDFALYRRKKYDKWRTGRPILSLSPIRKKRVHPFMPRVPDGIDVRLSSLSSLPSRKVNSTPFPAQPVQGKPAVGVAASNAAETPVTLGSNISKTAEQNNRFVNVCFSLYRLRHAPHSPPGKVPKYAFEFRTIETDFKNLPEHPFPQFPPEFEHTIGPVSVDDLLFHSCFIVTSKAVRMPLAAFSAATRPLTETQAGAAMLYLAKALLLLTTHIAILVLSMCGMSFSYRWCPATGHSTE